MEGQNGVQVALEGQFEAQNGVQVAPGGQFGGANGVQVTLGGQFEGPNGVQVALGGQFEGPNGVQVALGGVQVALGVHLEGLLLHFPPFRSGALVRLGTTTECMISADPSGCHGV